MWKIQVQSLHREDPLEEGVVTHCSILAWRMPRTVESGGLQSMVSKQLRLSTLTRTCLNCYNPLILQAGKVRLR